MNFISHDVFPPGKARPTARTMARSPPGASP